MFKKKKWRRRRRKNCRRSRVRMKRRKFVRYREYRKDTEEGLSHDEVRCEIEDKENETQ